jgi:hypothetical protein
MALVPATLAAAIEAIRTINIENGAIDNSQAASMLAEAIDAYIKTGTVVVSGGSSAGAYVIV